MPGPLIEPAGPFCRQSFPVPIFIFETGSDWIYQGDVQVENWIENAIEIGLHKKYAGRNDISRVIFLRKPAQQFCTPVRTRCQSISFGSLGHLDRRP